MQVQRWRGERGQTAIATTAATDGRPQDHAEDGVPGAAAGPATVKARDLDRIDTVAERGKHGRRTVSEPSTGRRHDQKWCRWRSW
jgi:hypothetical protein